MKDRVYKVRDRANLIRVNGAIINTDRTQYNAALARRKTQQKLGTLEERVLSLEEKLDKILEIIQR